QVVPALQDRDGAAEQPRGRAALQHAAVEREPLALDRRLTQKAPARVRPHGRTLSPGSPGGLESRRRGGRPARNPGRARFVHPPSPLPRLTEPRPAPGRNSAPARPTATASSASDRADRINAPARVGPLRWTGPPSGSHSPTGALPARGNTPYVNP